VNYSYLSDGAKLSALARKPRTWTSPPANTIKSMTKEIKDNSSRRITNKKAVNEAKKAAEEYPDEYKLTRSLWITIPLWGILGVLIYGCFEFNWQRDWDLLLVLSIFCLGYIFIIFQYSEYAIFNHKGLLIVHSKRWGKNKAKQEFYIDWKDVKHIKFNIFITGSLSPPAIDVVSRIFGRGYYHPTALSYCKFASLAKYYSGRKDVVMLWKKRKLFEKDW
jgi:hypothetical protein